MRKILYIDDNTNLLEEILDALKFEGFQVYGASDGQQGIEIAKTQKPNLILCDIMMPGIDGFEIYKQIKEDTSTSLIPFIFLTALAEPDEIRKGMELGVDDYIIKPILLKDLLNIISIRLKKSEEINGQIQTQLNELRDRVLHSLPHELLTHLNGILGFASLIKNDAESMSRSEIKVLATELELSGNRLHNLINNYLNYVSITVKNDSDLINIKLNNIHDTIEEVSTQVAEKYERVDDLILKLADTELLISQNDIEYLIRELVDNAFKFSERKSKVKVIMNTANNDLVEISIIDYGVGFHIDNMTEIGAFNQFNYKKQSQQGSGMGLITSILIAQRYKGSILISNNKLGTSVTLSLPIKSEITAS